MKNRIIAAMKAIYTSPALLLGLLSIAASASGETAQLKATADIWVSSEPEEVAFSAGRYGQFKLKTIQELAAIRFEATPAAGREILKARLLLHREGETMLRNILVSTVSADWEEGTNAKRLAPGDGATFNYADSGARRLWALPGSQMCDVIFGAGYSLHAVSERRELEDGWISVDVPADLVYCMVSGDSDGLCVTEGGSLALFNNFISSVQSKFPPRLEVELGAKLDKPPAAPKVQAVAAPERSGLGAGAIRLTIEADTLALHWRLKIGGKPVERWRVARPAAGRSTTFYLDELPPDAEMGLELVAVARGGAASPATILKARGSAGLAMPPALPKPVAPAAGAEPPQLAGTCRVWAAPPLVKISPETGQVMNDDAGVDGDCRTASSVWDGRTVRLFGGRGEYVSFQLCIENLSGRPLADVKITPGPLAGPGGSTIEPADIELFRNWYAQNKDKQWQPAYLVPLERGAALAIPDPQRKLDTQKNQSCYVDVYVPKTAKPGLYKGQVKLRVGQDELSIPLEVEALGFDIPDRLCFWPQLNHYAWIKNRLDYYRLAHQNRCVWYFRYPGGGLPTAGKGKELKVDFAKYDEDFGPLLSGEAFKNNRRSGVPVECAALPFHDSWPTPLTSETYDYPHYWPKRGDKREALVEHYMKAKPIEAALSRDYQDAFAAATRQFIEHFKAKAWDRTEMQCVFVGKITHRTDFGGDTWWTTDEPYFWADWRALQFFNQMFASARGDASPKLWAARADISRPQWMGDLYDGALDVVYFGGFLSSPVSVRRCQTVARRAPLDLRTYGGLNADNTSNTSAVAQIVNSYIHGASALLPWQTLGNDKSLDVNDGSVGGSAVLVPGDRFGVAAVADMRLRAYRDAQQICEYLNLIQSRHNLSRPQVCAMVMQAVGLEAGRAAGANADDADAVKFAALKDWQIAGLRRALAELIVAGPARSERPRADAKGP